VFLFTGAYLAGVVTFFVNARYRLPLLGVWLPLAGATLVAAVAWARARAWPRLAAGVALALAGVAVGRAALVAIDPARDGANAAAIALQRGDVARARSYLEEALAANPDSSEANLAMGVALGRLGRAAEAEVHYLRAVESRPDAIAYNNLGAWYRQQGDLGRAEAAFQQAVALRPSFAPARNNLGIVYAARGEHERALAEFEAAARADRRSCRAETNLGVLLSQLGRSEEARRHLARALDIDPGCEGAAEALAPPAPALPSP